MGPLLLLGDRYRLDGRIGAGAMGEVWRATDVILHRTVAVKLLRPELAQHEEDLARFRAEARSAASVPHPCVAQVYDYGEDGSCGQPYLVMELVEGVSLDHLLDGGPLEAAFTMDIVAQAAQGLAAAHSAGLVHRDIKPQNLLVTPGGQIKITDFGIARAAGSAPVTGAGEIMCTPAYLAPEQARGAAATPAADLYALGIVAYECLAGRLPFTGEPLAVMLAHQQQPLPPLPTAVPGGVTALVVHLTAKDPRARPASAADAAVRASQLHAALTAGAVPSGSLPAEPAPAAAEPPEGAAEDTWHRDRDRPRWRHQRRTAALAGMSGLALASVGAIGLTGWMLAHPSGAPATHQPPDRAAGAHPSARAAHHQHFTGIGRDNTATPPVTTPLSRAPTPTGRPSSPTRTPSPGPSSPSPTTTPTTSPTASTAPTSSPTPSATPTASATSPSPIASITPSQAPSRPASATGNAPADR